MSIEVRELNRTGTEELGRKGSEECCGGGSFASPHDLEDESRGDLKKTVSDATADTETGCILTLTLTLDPDLLSPQDSLSPSGLALRLRGKACSARESIENTSLRGPPLPASPITPPVLRCFGHQYSDGFPHQSSDASPTIPVMPSSSSSCFKFPQQQLEWHEPATSTALGLPTLQRTLSVVAAVGRGDGGPCWCGREQDGVCVGESERAREGESEREPRRERGMEEGGVGLHLAEGRAGCGPATPRCQLETRCSS